jgi:Holliday junction resolvasome RuvABC DNA-binding subunit
MTPSDKLHAALRALGFREAEARRAIATVVKMHDRHEPLPLEQALREAVLVATAA